MNKLNYEVNVLVNGKPVREYQKDNLVFIEGKKGTHYEIRVKNNSWNRIKAIVYVDGNSVLSDDNDDSGYVINAYDSLNVKGFRTSEDTEAEFIFSTKGESRAQTVKGYAKNCGAIGVKIVEEKMFSEKIWNAFEKAGIKHEWNEPTYGGYNTDTHYYQTDYVLDKNNLMEMKYSCNCNMVQEEIKSPLRSASFDLGTKMGDDVESKITYTTFESGRTSATFEIHYASRKGLKDMGINLKREKQAHIPDAFGGFCRRPKNN